MTTSLYVRQAYWKAGYAEGSIQQALLDLITSEHRVQPKFMAAVEALTSGLVDTQRFIGHLSVIHDIDVSGGEQLDHVGQWIGISRYVPVPLERVFFSWDDIDLDLGWDAGSWRGPFDSGTIMSRLPDDAYRVLLRAKIAANCWDGTPPGAFNVLRIAFGTDNQIILQDGQDMSMAISFAGAVLSSAVVALIMSGALPLKPSGVRINFYGIPVNTGKLFAWDSEGPTLGGWEEANWVREVYPPRPVIGTSPGGADFSWDVDEVSGWERGIWRTGI